MSRSPSCCDGPPDVGFLARVLFEPIPPQDEPREPRYRPPPWFSAPEGTLAGVVPLELVLAKTDTGDRSGLMLDGPVRAVLLDLEGTLHASGELLPGASAAVQGMRESGVALRS